MMINNASRATAHARLSSVDPSGLRYTCIEPIDVALMDLVDPSLWGTLSLFVGYQEYIYIHLGRTSGKEEQARILYDNGCVPGINPCWPIVAGTGSGKSG